MSPWVMVAVVMIGGRHGGGVWDDGAVCSVGVRRRARYVVQEPVRLGYVTLQRENFQCVCTI